MPVQVAKMLTYLLLTTHWASCAFIATVDMEGEVASEWLPHIEYHAFETDDILCARRTTPVRRHQPAAVPHQWQRRRLDVLMLSPC